MFDSEQFSTYWIPFSIYGGLVFDKKVTFLGGPVFDKKLTFLGGPVFDKKVVFSGRKSISKNPPLAGAALK